MAQIYTDYFILLDGCVCVCVCGGKAKKNNNKKSDSNDDVKHNFDTYDGYQ
jgi:hypothetical protein